jgi:hypothetical protein
LAANDNGLLFCKTTSTSHVSLALQGKDEIDKVRGADLNSVPRSPYSLDRIETNMIPDWGEFVVSNLLGIATDVAMAPEYFSNELCGKLKPIL